MRGIARKLRVCTPRGKKIIREIVEKAGLFVPHHFSSEEVKVIRKLYPDVDGKIVARKLRRSLRSIYRKANALGVRKSRKWLEKQQRIWIKILLRKGKPYRFKEGEPV